MGTRAVLDPYPVDAMCDGAHGAPLIPWPNRLEDGSYHFDGVDHQVALSEPSKHNAIHGLMRWRPWQAVEHADGRVVMAARLHPMGGYPFDLDVQIAYELGDDGLTVSTTATNRGRPPVPLWVRTAPLPVTRNRGDRRLHVAGGRRDAPRDRRRTPAPHRPGSRRRDGARLPPSPPARRPGDRRCLHRPHRDLDGRAWARLGSPDSGTVELWVDEHHPFIEIYTGDTLAPGRRRRGLGAEPMTCPPNAFHSGEAVIALDPGQSLTTRWGVRLTA